jgi:hypothetical protein
LRYNSQSREEGALSGMTTYNRELAELVLMLNPPGPLADLANAIIQKKDLEFEGVQSRRNYEACIS